VFAPVITGEGCTSADMVLHVPRGLEMHRVSSDAVAWAESAEEVEAVSRIKGLPVNLDVRAKDILSLPTVNARTAPPGLVVARVARQRCVLWKYVARVSVLQLR
jgi:hypothetical protein